MFKVGSQRIIIPQSTSPGPPTGSSISMQYPTAMFHSAPDPNTVMKATLLIQRWWLKIHNPKRFQRRRWFSACQFGIYSVLHSMLRNEFDPDEIYLEDPYELGRTALHIAAAAGYSNIVKDLIAWGAVGSIRDAKGNTALHYCCMNVASFLEQLKSDGQNKWKVAYSTTDIPPGCVEAAKIIIKKQPGTIDIWNNENQGALHLASAHGLALNVEALCEAKADLNHQDDMKRTPLHLAAWRGDDEAVRILLDHGANYKLTNKVGRTPLHVAAVYGHTRVARQLVNHGAPLDVINHNGNTPLHLSIADGFFETAAYLVEQGASTHLTNCYGECPLLIAADKNIELAKLMLDRRRTTKQEAVLYGDTESATYDFVGLDDCKVEVFEGVNVPGLGEVHPMSPAAIEYLKSLKKLEERQREVNAIENAVTQEQQPSRNSSNNEILPTKTSAPTMEATRPKNNELSIALKASDVVKLDDFNDDSDLQTLAPPPAPASQSQSTESLASSSNTKVLPSLILPTPVPSLPFSGPSSPTGSLAPKASPPQTPMAKNVSTPVTPFNRNKLLTKFASFISPSSTQTVALIPENQKQIGRKRAGSLRERATKTNNTFIQHIVLSNNRELTNHPVIIKLLELKWKHFGRDVFIKSLISHCLLTVLWTVASIAWLDLSLTPSDSRYQFDLHSPWAYKGSILQLLCYISVLCIFFYIFVSNIWHQYTDPTRESGFKGFWFSLVSKSSRHTWWMFDMVMVTFGITASVVFISLSATNECGVRCFEFARSSSAIVSFLIWCRYLQFITVARRTGPFVKIIVVMLRKDLRDFMSVYSVFLFAFAHALFIMLHGLISEDQTTSFNNPITALLATFRLLVSDYSSLYEKYQDLSSQVVIVITTLFYVLYMILATVLMLNLLIAMLDDTWSQHKDSMEQEWRVEWAKRILAMQDALISQRSTLPYSVPNTYTHTESTSQLKKVISPVEERLQMLDDVVNKSFKSLNLAARSIITKLESFEHEARKEKTAARVHSSSRPGTASKPSQFEESPGGLYSHSGGATSGIARDGNLSARIHAFHQPPVYSKLRGKSFVNLSHSDVFDAKRRMNQMGTSSLSLLGSGNHPLNHINENPSISSTMTSDLGDIDGMANAFADIAGQLHSILTTNTAPF